MAPVSILITTTGKTYRTTSLVSTEVAVMIEQALVDWVTAINEPNEISVVARQSNATSKSAYPIGTMLGFHKTSTGGSFSYGLFMHDTGAAANNYQLNPFHTWTGLGSSNNGYGSYTNVPLGVVDSASGVGIWKSGDGFNIRIVYCADSGNQYFFVLDDVLSGSVFNIRGIARLNRPAGPSYPSKSLTSEFVAFHRGPNLGDTIIVSTIAVGAGGSNIPWTAASTNMYNLYTGSAPIYGTLHLPDDYYIWAGPPVFCRDLYMGNLPAGIGVAASMSRFAVLTYGTETWRSFAHANPRLMVREAI